LVTELAFCDGGIGNYELTESRNDPIRLL